MRYHHGKGWWKTYTGEKKYVARTKWADTDEAKAEKQARKRSKPRASTQLMASSGSTVEYLFASYLCRFSTKYALKSAA
jgi:hypothetical protein